jgi:heme/copper-type cytochrome/quinol oxidase subunit 3
MKSRVVADLAALPSHGQGSASVTWWGTWAFMLIEGTGFALGIAVYLYLLSIAPDWPLRAPVPDLRPGTIITVLLIASLIPNHVIATWAKQQKLRHVQVGIVMMTASGIAPLVVRAFEFPALGISWDSNAYGSVVWLLLGLHTTHLITDLVDTLVLAVIMFTRHGDNGRRFGDIEDNAMYWNFVVLTWLPLYGCIYWIPRL